MTTKLTAFVFSTIFSLSLLGCQSEPSNIGSSAVSGQATVAPLKIATWNMEHLAYPSSAGCRPRDEREISALRDYAKGLNADVIALQEVASVKALEQVFPSSEWQLLISSRANSATYDCRGNGNLSTQQKTAFAIRNNLVLSKVDNVSELSVDVEGLRHGLVVTLDTQFGELSVLNVHLKSGCFVDNYSTSDKKACRLLAEQLPVLKSWLEKHANSNTIVLGDFNHRLSHGDNQFWQQLTKHQNSVSAPLVNATETLTGCHPRYPVPIDHILLSNKLANTVKFDPSVHFFADMSEEKMLSDHCAISVSISMR